MDGSRNWYAVYVRSRCENRVHRELCTRGVESFLPLLETVRQWSDRKKKVFVPLFRGYVFVHIDHVREHIPVLETDGVVKFIGIGRTPSVIGERDIDWIRRLVREPDALLRTVPAIPPGRRVRVIAGPFRELEGVVVKTGRDERLVIFFDSIMQGVEIAIPSTLLVPLSASEAEISSSGILKKTPCPDMAVTRHLLHP